MSRIKILLNILIVTCIILVLSLVYIIFFNKDPNLPNNYAVGIVSGITSSAIITIAILSLEYSFEKKKYIHDVIMYLTRLLRAIRHERYGIIEDLLWCDNMCCFCSQKQYILNKELLILITNSNDAILELNNCHSNCVIYGKKFLDEKAKFDEIYKKIDKCRHELVCFRDKKQKKHSKNKKDRRINPRP